MMWLEGWHGSAHRWHIVVPMNTPGCSGQSQVFDTSWSPHHPQSPPEAAVPSLPIAGLCPRRSLHACICKDAWVPDWPFWQGVACALLAPAVARPQAVLFGVCDVFSHTPGGSADQRRLLKLRACRLTPPDRGPAGQRGWATARLLWVSSSHIATSWAHITHITAAHRTHHCLLSIRGNTLGFSSPCAGASPQDVATGTSAG